jgi:hypothetical protein
MNSFQEPHGPESEVFPNGEMFPDCKLGKNAIMQNYWFTRQWFLLASELHRAKFTLFEPSSASPSSQKELFGTGYTMQSRTAMFFYATSLLSVLFLALQPCFASAEQCRGEAAYVALNLCSICWMLPVIALLNEGIYCLRMAEKVAELLQSMAKCIETDEDLMHWHTCGSILNRGITTFCLDFGKAFALCLALSLIGVAVIVYRFFCVALSSDVSQCNGNFEVSWPLYFASCSFGCSACVIVLYAFKIDSHLSEAALNLSIGRNSRLGREVEEVEVEVKITVLNFPAPPGISGDGTCEL